MRFSLPFYKMVASGNDFVVVDNRKGIVGDIKEFARKVCAGHTGIGADGVLLLENSRRADFKMRIINSDGSEAEACGNGFRCIALFAKEKLSCPSEFRFESLAGIITAHVKAQRVCVELPVPSELELDQSLEALGHRLHYAFLNTGVPHAVIFVEGLPKIDVEEIGRAVRHHGNFKPRGTNVNFVQVENDKTISVRTYERGVENETLACGTGSTASAVVSVLKGYVRSPVQVKTRGGEILEINIQCDGKKITRVTLEGEARFVCEGKMAAGLL